jgi:hypothetical protein
MAYYPRASRSPSATIEVFVGKLRLTVDSAADDSTFHSLGVEPTVFRSRTRTRLHCVHWGMVAAAERLEQGAA